MNTRYLDVFSGGAFITCSSNDVTAELMNTFHPYSFLKGRGKMVYSVTDMSSSNVEKETRNLSHISSKKGEDRLKVFKQSIRRK